MSDQSFNTPKGKRLSITATVKNIIAFFFKKTTHNYTKYRCEGSIFLSSANNTRRIVSSPSQI
jgi:hypothetical protein